MTRRHNAKTERNTEIIREVKAGKRTLHEIAAAYGVSKSRVQQIALRHNLLISAAKGLYIREDEAEKAVALVGKGLSIAETARQLGRSKHGVTTHLLARGAHTVWNTATPWTQAEEKHLRSRYGRRGAAREIADALGRTRNEVIGKARRMGLSKPALEMAA